MKDITIRSRKPLFVVVVLHAILLHAAYFTLVAVFEFPDILRKPPLEMLTVYQNGQPFTQIAYYIFTLSGLSLLAVSILFYLSEAKKTIAGTIGAVFGGLTGILTSFGFIRWVFLVPVLGDISAARPSNSVNVIDQLAAFHAYAGVALGENLAFVCHGIWMVLLSISLRTSIGLQRSLQVVGVVVGAGIGIYSLEQFGGPFAALAVINIPLQMAWLVWMVMVTLALLKSKQQPEVQRYSIRGLGIGLIAFLLLYVTTLL